MAWSLRTVKELEVSKYCCSSGKLERSHTSVFNCDVIINLLLLLLIIIILLLLLLLSVIRCFTYS